MKKILVGFLIALFAALSSHGQRPPLYALGRTTYPLPVRYDWLDTRSGIGTTASTFTNIFGMVNTHPMTLDIVSNITYFAITELSDGGNTQQVYAIEGVNGTQRHRMSLPNNLLNLFSLYTVNGTLYGFGAQQLTQKIFRINPGAGTLTQLAAHTNFAGIQSVAFDPVSNLVFITTLTADFSGNRFAVLNATNGAFISLLARSNDFSETFTHRGALYGLSPLGGTSRLIRVNSGTGGETHITAYPTNFGTVGASTVDREEGRVYVSGTDALTNIIRRINITNGVIEATYRPVLQYLSIIHNPWLTLPEIDVPAATVSWHAASGFTYRVQSAGQVTGTWANIGSIITGLGGETQLLHSTTATTQFYRVITKP